MHDGTITIRGKRWKLEFTLIDGHRGDCHGPHVKNKRIRIHHRQHPQNLLDTLIHEMLHAAMWDLDDDAVTETAADIAKVLWNQGWKPSDA